MINRHLMIGVGITLFAGSTGCGANCYQPFSGDPIPGCHENIRGGAVASVSILVSSDSVEVGQVAVLNFELRPPPGKTLPYSVTVSWESSDTSVAVVENGYVLGKRLGVATISATARGVVGTKVITVTPVYK